jgi:YVTN family beta-propeller protein
VLKVKYVQMYPRADFKATQDYNMKFCPNLLKIVLLVMLLYGNLQAQQETVRIIQTNAAGDNVHIIDPTTNQVVDVILGIPIAHGVTSHPDASRYYFSNEVEHTLDIVSSQTLRVIRQIPLSGRPNNIAITPDGQKVYVAIRDDLKPGVDVIDLTENQVIKTIHMLGGVHNVFITPDGRHLTAGMIGAETLTVIDTSNDEPLWSMHFDGGVRPMAFETNPDNSTKRIFVQISNFHGVYVIDFEQKAVTEQLWMPELPISRTDNDALQGSPGHGLAVSPNGSQLWSTSKPNGYVYAWSLPDLEFLGGVPVGRVPDWLTMTPDGKYLYVANAGSNDVSVIDTQNMVEITKIPVGQVPKRNHTVIFR